MKSKDKSAFVAWLSHGPTKWMLALGLFSGTLSCASDTSQSEEPITASESQEESQSAEDSDLFSDKDEQKDTSTETIGSLTPEESADPSGEDSIEKTLASLSTDDSPPDSYQAAEPPSAEPPSKSLGTKSPPTGKNPIIASATPSATYVVAAGDSLTKIAKKIFGHTKFWEEIATLNELNPPFKIYPGQGLRYPLINAQAKSFAEDYRKTQKTITVQKGDSLSKLAAKVFGTQDSWQKLFNYNKDKILDPNFLPAGITLAYFDGAGVTPVEAQPAAQPKVEPAPAPVPAAQPKVKQAPTPTPAAPKVLPQAPKLLPPAPKPPVPPVKQALKAKALPGKPVKKTTKGQTNNKKAPAKGAKSSLKISPNDLNSP